MINTQLEEIVSLALDAYLNANGDRSNFKNMGEFELQFRRLLMRKYCDTTQIAKKQHTYTITAGEGTMGKWTTKECPPNMDTKQLLNG